MFFMPMMVGAVAAKKLLVKVLLFLFPALAHLFKLCKFAPHHGGTKFHHHKHQIAHIHHVGHGGHHHHHPHGGVEVIAPHADGPPSLGGSFDHDEHHPHIHEGPHWHGQASLHHFSDIDPPHKPLYNPHEQELEYFSGGPALGHQ